MNTIGIHVKLFARLREHLPPDARGEATLELPAGLTIAQLLERLDLGERVKLITVNGERVDDRARVLGDGDEVRVFPIVVGG